MTSTLSPSEEAQLGQTVEMFEVITESQPHDYQSLEILKEAYSKLGRQRDVIGTSKRIAEAYVQMGQLSSAILEYETILQRFPDDPEVQAALKEIESRANNFPTEAPVVAPEPPPMPRLAASPASPASPIKGAKVVPKTSAPSEIDDGRRTMYKIFVESRIITAGDFDGCWSTPDLSVRPAGVNEPFIQLLSDRAILTVDEALKTLCDQSRVAFLSLNTYDIDLELARGFPAEICRRWCVLPFDRMSKSIFVATANPFNQQAAKELTAATNNRLLWYLVPPSELVANVRKAFR